MKDIKKEAKKFLNWIWKSESILSYIVFLLIVFIIIKFIFFPLLSLATGTELPLAIVESCSMFHKGNLLSNTEDFWQSSGSRYEQYNISQKDFQGFKFKKGFNKGDVLFMIRADPDKLKVGEVILFNSGVKSTPIIHRIIKIQEKDGERIFSTLGDNNQNQLSFEIEIQEDQLIGKAAIRLAPYIGWVKLIFFEHRQPSSNKGLCDSNF